MFGLATPLIENLHGFWQPAFTEPSYRIPVIAAFLALCGSLALLAGAEEFWHADQLLGCRDAGNTVLARTRRRALHGLVSADPAADDLSA